MRKLFTRKGDLKEQKTHPAGTYQYIAKCDNCNALNTIHIKKGIRIYTYMLSTKDVCIKCGCELNWSKF